MIFLSFSNIYVLLGIIKFIKRSYIAIEVLSTTNWVKIIYRKKFAKIAIDKNSKTLIVYMSTLKVIDLSIYLF